MKAPTGVPSGRHMTSEGMKPSVSMYQRALLSKSGRFEHEVTELCDLRRLERGPLCIVHPDVWLGALWGSRAAIGSGSGLAIAVSALHLDALRVAKAHNGSAAGSLNGLNRDPQRFGKRLEVPGARGRG